MSKKLIFFCAALFSLQGAALIAQEEVTTPSQMKWGSHPALPEEIKVAALSGDPTKKELFVLRLKVPAGTKIAPHWHPIDEHVTVLSGSMKVGNGDKFETANGIDLPVGSFISIPAKHHHYAWFPEDSLIQINDIGPWNITYINPKDDPRNK